jgi:outer membrane protein assembly factor BamB
VSIGPNRTPDERRKDFPTPYEEYAKIGYRPDWVGYPAVTGSLPVRLMEPYDDIVVTVEGGSTVSVLEGGTGTRRCSYPLETPLTRFVGIARDATRVLCAAESDVYVVDPQTCTLTGREKIEKIVATEPVMHNGMLIFGTGSGELLAHLTRSGVSGVKAWGFAIRGSIEHKPVLVGDAVGVVSQAGQVLFCDAQSGSLLGKNFVYSGLDTDPVADEHLMYVACLDQSIYAFSPQGASLVWRVRTAAPLRVQPTVYAGRLYCTVPGQGLTAFDCANGSVVWTCKGFNGTVIGVSRKNLVGFDKATGEAVTIDLERGDVIGRARTTGVVMMKPDKFENGNMYALSKSGLVGKFLPK